MADKLPPFIRLVVAGDMTRVRRQLAGDPGLATLRASTGATRAAAKAYFIPGSGHYLYPGDTALHMAAGAFQPEVVALLIQRGADVHAKNRLGAMPLHYAADGNHWNPDAQAETIRRLVSAGADPNATNRLGVTPLHRAVRTRSSAAVKALLDAGADPRRKNRSGSTPLRLAQLTTGRGGSGSARSRHEQAEILRLLSLRLDRESA